VPADDSESFWISVLGLIPGLVELKSGGEMEACINGVVNCLVSRTSVSEGESTPTRALVKLPRPKKLDIFIVTPESFPSTPYIKVDSSLTLHRHCKQSTDAQIQVRSHKPHAGIGLLQVWVSLIDVRLYFRHARIRDGGNLEDLDLFPPDEI
jgi:hypothetical protein